jgi:glycosyltransferase involved in cell wall biosynthesis
MRTRFRRIIRQIEMLFLGWIMLPTALKMAREFKPDLILTIPDNDVSWCAYLLAKRLKLPFVTNFQDWWPHNQYWSESERPFPSIRKLIERRFRKMYASSELAFCTSEGMKEFLGDHPNAVTLFPCPGEAPKEIKPARLPDGSRPIRIVYAGTVSGDYGRMVLALAKRLHSLSDKFDFQVYGPRPDWATEDTNWARNAGIYRGFIPHEQLRPVMAKADAFISVMSFEPIYEIMSRVSFTTKFLEYTQYGRPVIVWGPSYCQPVRVAETTGAGLPITTPDVEDVVASLELLLDLGEYSRLTAGAIRAAETFFSPDAIHDIFRDNLLAVVKKK